MKDYRLPEHRQELFSSAYKANLDNGILPGLVYRYLEQLSDHFNWDVDEKLWFAFLNGNTQNPITSLQIMHRWPEVPRKTDMDAFQSWFDANWGRLKFDTDRRYQKRDLPRSVWAYSQAVDKFGSQAAMLAKDTPYKELWKRVQDNYYSFGRLGAFSYLEYVYIMGFGSDCDDLMFADKSGSKSHRNGFLMLKGYDELVWDKRLPNGQDGNYHNFKEMCQWITEQSDIWLDDFEAANPSVEDVSRFTFESQLCTTKNHFFKRRYTGVYALMASQRIRYAMDNEVQSDIVNLFKDLYGTLPAWLWDDPATVHKVNLNDRAAVFMDTGVPYNAEHFMELDK